MDTESIALEKHLPTITLGKSTNDALLNAKFRTNFKGEQKVHIKYLCFRTNEQEHYVKLNNIKREKKVKMDEPQLKNIFHKGANIVPNLQTTKEIKKVIRCSKKHFNGNEGEVIGENRKKEIIITKNKLGLSWVKLSTNLVN